MGHHIAIRRPAVSVAFLLALLGSIAPPAAPAVVLAADPARSVELAVSWTRPGVPDTTFTPPAALRVGDEVTLTPLLAGFETLPGASCLMAFSRGDGSGTPLFHGWLFSDGTGPTTCAPWTFVLPQTTTGVHTAMLYVSISEDEIYDPTVSLTVEAGGASRPFTSSIPLMTWDPVDLFGAVPLHFGEAWTFPAAVGAEHDCQYTINGSYLTGLSVRGDADACAAWTVTVPDIRPPALRSSEPNGYPWQVEFIGEWWREDTATSRAWGHTITGEVLVDDAEGEVAFTSTRPAAVFAADDNPYFAYPGTVRRVARIVGLTEGTCRYEQKLPGQDPVPAGSVPIVDGACAPLEIDVPTTGALQAWLYLEDAEGHAVAAAWTGGEIIEPLPDPVIELPPDPVVGEPVEIDASTPGGAPLEYEIEPVLETATAGYATAAAAGPVACEDASGTFLLDEGDRSATATCTFPAAGTYRVTATFRDPIGTERQTSTTIAIAPDTDAPTITGLRQRLVPGSQLGTSAIPVQIAWTASDAGSGVDHVEVARQTDGGAWVVIDGDLEASSITRDQYRGHRYRFRVRAVDGAGNVSPWSYTATFGPTAYSETNAKLRYTGTWTTAPSSGAYGGAFRATSRAGASATITFTGRSVAWVAPRSPIRGWAKVYLDGAYKGRVNLGATGLEQRRLVFAWNWTTRGTHTLRIVNEATSGRPRIDLDAIVVLD